MRMFVSAINIQFGDHLLAEFILRQHPFDRQFDDQFRLAGKPLAEIFGPQSAGISRVVLITFLFRLHACGLKTTGMKAEQKSYKHYTGYPGGLRSEDFRERFARKPELIIELAVERMLPKNKLGKQMITKLNVYRGDKHPHQAQKPPDLALKVG